MNPRRLLIPILAAVLFTAAAKKSTTTSAVPSEVRSAMKMFRAEAMKAHVAFLASDLLEGRGPGTRGDQLTQQYIASQFAAAGLQPAGDKGTYFQKVSLLGMATIPESTSVSFVKDGATIGPLKHLDDFVGTDQTQSEKNALGSDVIFVGHGVEAPEYKWDDYKGIDTKGKTLVMIASDPPATATEPDLFKGKARTYYGRWTYKFEIGTVKNAEGVILIHTDDTAGYGWSVVRNSWGGERSYVRNEPGQPALRFAGWMTQKVAADLFKAAGHDLGAMMKAAASRDFKPVPLGAKFTGNIATKIRPFDTANVLAKVAGSDPKLRDQAIVYSGHHDHLGIGKADESGDNIYNGAVDNGTGVALLIEMGRVWAQSGAKPKRSVIFAAVAAEEQGLLGSEFLGLNPPVPAGRLALNLNFDAILQIGRVKDVQMVGAERTTFYPTAERVTKALGLRIVPDTAPEQGFYYRSDHFSLAKVGVPAFSIDAGSEVIGKPADFGKKKEDEYRAKHYHQPGDELRADWDWSTAVQMAELGYWLGWEAANGTAMPAWKPGDEFEAARAKSLAALKR
ncbi:MAG TPA: M28 family peptidase [Thermoanaerobaculia bacterium]|nr:M28 family peptidase [Thermoanaerobaculia bacterium]